MALLNETEAVLSYLDKEVSQRKENFCFISVFSRLNHNNRFCLVW